MELSAVSSHLQPSRIITSVSSLCPDSGKIKSFNAEGAEDGRGERRVEAASVDLLTALFLAEPRARLSDTDDSLRRSGSPVLYPPS